MTGAAPAISVIIPVRNRTALLVRCLDSVQAAAGPAREILVVDDGDDPTLAPALEGLATLIRPPRPVGAAAARNLAAERARGRFLWFLDSDSLVLDPQAMAAAVRILDAHPAVGAVGGELLRAADGSLQLQHKILLPNGSARTELLDPATVRERPADYLPTCACMVRAVAFRDVGGFDPGYGFLSEDTDLCARLWRWGHAVWVDGRCGVLHDQRHGREQGDLPLMLRNELRFAILHLPHRRLPLLPVYQLGFVLSPHARARLRRGDPGVMKHLGPVEPGARPSTTWQLAAVGGRYLTGLARAWGWNLRHLRETAATRRRLDAATPHPPRFPPRSNGGRP